MIMYLRNRKVGRTLREQPRYQFAQFDVGCKTPVVIRVPEGVRKWRASKTETIQLVDVRKAYNNIEIDEHLRCWLGIRLPGEKSIGKLKKLPFGLNIAGKVLRTVLEQVLPNEVLRKDEGNFQNRV